MKILITGTAGFIGMHTAEKLLARGDVIIGLDNMNDYYDVELKKARLRRLEEFSNYTHIHVDIADREAVEGVFSAHKPQRVINLAAQAGVRYAVTNPHVYISSNITGFLHILEGCRHHGVEHVVFASTSSVYGANTDMPFSEHSSTEHPITLYAASKKANEMMAHSYAHLYGIACTGLRFFTVYGPWGRPDMALFMFTKSILAGEPIKVFNHGKHSRSFTYVDDIVEGVIRAIDNPAKSNPTWNSSTHDPATSNVPYRIYNIGSSENTSLMRYIEVLEGALGKKAKLEMLPLQAGDVPDTFASCSDLQKELGYMPKVTVEEGVTNFVNWYQSFYS
jgi:UDP-glucuronate 4-epimerase